MYTTPFVFTKNLRALDYGCLSPSETLHTTRTWVCLFSKTNNELEYVRWKTSRLHSMLSRRSSRINTSFSGFISCTPLYFIYQNRNISKYMGLLCPLFQNQYSNTPWFFRSGTQKDRLSGLYGVCCFAPSSKDRSLFRDVPRLCGADTWTCSKIFGKDRKELYNIMMLWSRTR